MANLCFFFVANKKILASRTGVSSLFSCVQPRFVQWGVSACSILRGKQNMEIIWFTSWGDVEEGPKTWIWSQKSWEKHGGSGPKNVAVSFSFLRVEDVEDSSISDLILSTVLHGVFFFNFSVWGSTQWIEVFWCVNVKICKFTTISMWICCCKACQRLVHWFCEYICHIRFTCQLAENSPKS